MWLPALTFPLNLTLSFAPVVYSPLVAWQMGREKALVSDAGRRVPTRSLGFEDRVYPDVNRGSGRGGVEAGLLSKTFPALGEVWWVWRSGMFCDFRVTIRGWIGLFG